jgi:hypothetical protein
MTRVVSAGIAAGLPATRSVHSGKSLTNQLLRNKLLSIYARTREERVNYQYDGAGMVRVLASVSNKI